MNYFVEWRAAAHERLEQIWMAADDKRNVVRAANRIDYLLRMIRIWTTQSN